MNVPISDRTSTSPFSSPTGASSKAEAFGEARQSAALAENRDAATTTRSSGLFDGTRIASRPPFFGTLLLDNPAMAPAVGAAITRFITEARATDVAGRPRNLADKIDAADDIALALAQNPANVVAAIGSDGQVAGAAAVSPVRTPQGVKLELQAMAGLTTGNIGVGGTLLRSAWDLAVRYNPYTPELAGQVHVDPKTRQPNPQLKAFYESKGAVFTDNDTFVFRSRPLL